MDSRKLKAQIMLVCFISLLFFFGCTSIPHEVDVDDLQTIFNQISTERSSNQTRIEIDTSSLQDMAWIDIEKMVPENYAVNRVYANHKPLIAAAQGSLNAQVPDRNASSIKLTANYIQYFYAWGKDSTSYKLFGALIVNWSTFCDGEEKIFGTAHSSIKFIGNSRGISTNEVRAGLLEMIAKLIFEWLENPQSHCSPSITFHESESPIRLSVN